MEQFDNKSLRRIGSVRVGTARNGLMRRLATCLALLSLGCLLATPGWATTTVLLNANFNDKPLDTQIGTGGPSVGEPISIHADLEAKVQALPLTTRSLHLKRLTSGTLVRYMDFEFLGGAEIMHDEVRIAYTLRAPATLTEFEALIREQGGTFDNFGTLIFTDGGGIRSDDDFGTTTNISTYAANDTLSVEYIYHVDAKTYDLRINNVLILDKRPHGVADPAEGIGRLVFGTSGTEEWVIDEIAVTHTTPNLLLLDANFNDKSLDVQIGTGGPTLGEPASLSVGLSAIVRAAPLASPSLHIGQASGSFTRSARFEFLDGEEARRGQLRAAFTVHTPNAPDIFQVRMREPSSNIRIFGGVDFTAGGQMNTYDSFNNNIAIGSYGPNQTLRFEFVYQVVASTYDLYVNGVLMLDDRAYDFTTADKGIGVVTAAITSSSTQEWVFDDLRVERSAALLDAHFNDQALDQRIGTLGARAGQPVYMDVGLTADVRNGPFPTQALALSHTTIGLTHLARFELIDSQEITQGELRISLRVLPPAAGDSFTVYIRQQGIASPQQFGALIFAANGNVLTTDAAGTETVSTWMPGVEQRFEFRYRMDAGTYDIYVDRLPMVVNRSWGLTTPGRGIGSILLLINAGSTGQWVVDDLFVYQPNDVLFKNGFD